MKYRNLKIEYEIDNVIFTAISVGEQGFDTPIPKHSHSNNSYEIHYISSGRGTLIANMIKYDISEGMLFITGPGVEHEQISDVNDPMIEFGIYLQVEPEITPAKGSLTDRFIKTSFFIGSVDESLYVTMKSILSELENQAFGYEFILPPLLKQLTISIIRNYEDTKPGSNPALKKASSPNDLLYLTIEEMFLYHYRDLSLTSLAETINLGTRQTERLLLKHYGKSFQKMRKDAKMSAALMLLTETSKSINEIADELGYSSSEHFSNAFRYEFKQSPLNYRKNQK